MKHACVSKGKTIKGDDAALEKLGDCPSIWKLVLGSFSGAQETGQFNLEHGRKWAVPQMGCRIQSGGWGGRY